ncbi:RRG9 [Acrasis kona]|uniref:RRG9 n=1 Tax=Acrasis kona TaxID=1008807 RepID=A0AAW2Z7B2_9EUKA
MLSRLKPCIQQTVANTRTFYIARPLCAGIERLKEPNSASLEWRESVLEGGTVLYRHPTFEEVLSVKQHRLSRQTALQKRKDQNTELRVSKFLTPEEVEKVRELHDQNPKEYTSNRLAIMFEVKPEYIVQVIHNLVLQSRAVINLEKKKLRDLAAHAKRKPKKSKQASSQRPTRV